MAVMRSVTEVKLPRRWPASRPPTGHCGNNEPFSSSDFAGLQDMDGFGQLACPPGAAAELAQDAPGLELGVGAFARAAQPGMSPVGVVLGLGPARRVDLQLRRSS